MARLGGSNQDVPEMHGDPVNAIICNFANMPLRLEGSRRHVHQAVPRSVGRRAARHCRNLGLGFHRIRQAPSLE
jgi:hypothetical protein